MVKKLVIVLVALMLQSCLTFKKIETNYYLKDSKVINDATQSVSGSEADGNTVKAALK
ncbi:MAG: hypothetical protein ACXQTI_06550 [Candidatus Nezhaarchaeales archaeon]